MFLSQPRSLAPDAASPAFAANRGLDATEVFRGELVVPDAPALAHRDQVTWQSPHAIEFLFTTSFFYRSGDLYLEVEGSPVAAATSPWWPIDYDLFTHDALLPYQVEMPPFGGRPVRSCRSSDKELSSRRS
jgi:hypothetical protein